MQTIHKFNTALLSILVLSGCWDRTEINDIAIVIGSSFDKAGEEYKITSQMPLPGGMGGAGSGGGGGGTSGDLAYYLDGATGKNVREAHRNLQESMSRRMVFGHRRIVVIGEELARAGLHDSLDVLTRSRDSRLSVQLFIAEGEGAAILSGNPHLEKLPSEAIRELGVRRYNIRLKQFLLDYQQRGSDPILPTVSIRHNQNPDKEQIQQQVESSKVAIFKGDKLQFFTNVKQTDGVSWMLAKMKGKEITVPYDTEADVTLSITEQSKKITHEIQNGKPKFLIDIDTSATMLENHTNINFEESKGYEMFEQKVNKHIEQQVKSILDATLSEGIDSFGLGWYLNRRESKKWQKWKKNWVEMLPELEVEIIVHSRIDLPGLMSKGIGVGE